MKRNTRRVIDLFAGCGGLSLGFERQGFSVVKAVEMDAQIAQTYKRNHTATDVIVDDIRNIDKSNIFHLGDADVIIGGPPCQGFSMAGERIRESFREHNKSDPRNYLFRHYFNVIKTVRPLVFVMENVKGIMTMQNGQVFSEILRTFSSDYAHSEEHYHVYHRIIKAVDFGIPQKRERIVIIGTLFDIDNAGMEKLWQRTIDDITKDMPHYFDAVTVQDAIGNLENTTSDGKVLNPLPQTEYQKYLASSAEFLMNHTQTNHSELAVERMRRVANGENYTSLNEDIKSVHSGSYGRLCWDDTAPTITTRFDTPSGGAFTHPDVDRTLSPREAARIQSFPDSFVFYGSKTSICKQIGNAVPPKIAYFLSRLTALIIDNGGNV